MEELILDRARTLFFSFGLKSVSMDDVARQCGISKKTLYQHFADRETLVDTVLESLLSDHATASRASAAAARNAVEELDLLLSGPFCLLAGINWTFFYELEKAFPKAWQRLQQYSRGDLKEAVLRNLERGIEEGTYRTTLNREFTAELRIHQLRTALQPGAFGALLPGPALMRQLTLFYGYSITNEKGRKLISNYFNDNDEPGKNKKK
ncbi:TetR/AcrR family transcriptional regulator [Flaviaesturariibacter aridisoli]|uniref:TetR/AcrR family transcriptional regulator n=1 Tax=Flaviaesturariibacter aridisoli TaxID=2545761 RepID=A0A4R4E3G9_9BACT|nr:TetR/AcrR family transcriptional regulator [Flaviaesturariibacter aridisoli]TCZ73373.1 TetR/AcrR family transcriptional regulator [Flaviaesturariibacter aridisoli]